MQTDTIGVNGISIFRANIVLKKQSEDNLNNNLVKIQQFRRTG